MLSGLRKYIQGVLSRARLLNQPAGGLVQFGQEVGRILNGVEYAMPPVVPYAIREDEQAVKEWTEAIPTSMRTQFGTPFPSSSPVHIPTVSRPLEEWDISTRQYVLEQCHLAWERDTIAKTAVFYTRAFSVQNGASISYKNEKVREVCEAFIDHPENALRDVEKGTVEALMTDGEAFFRFFKGDGQEGEKGELVMVPLTPWGVVGIKHDPGFWRRIEYYRYRVTVDGGDEQKQEFSYEDIEIPADEVLHIAINRKNYEMRGRPDLFAMLPWLRAYQEWLENRARQNYYRAALLWWVKLINATPAQVTAKLNAYKRPPSPISVAVTNDKEEWTQFSANVGAGDAADDGRAVRAMAATGARLPESWLSDGADANLATAKAQALPAVTSFAEFQDIMRDKFWVPILKRVIENAVEAGLLPAEVPVQDADGDPVPDAGTVKTVEAFEVTYSDLGKDDPKSVVEALVTAVNADLVSLATARGLTPWQLDAQKEEKQIDVERQKKLDDMAAGLMPGFGMFGQPPMNGNGNGQNGGPNGRQQDREQDEETRQAA